MRPPPTRQALQNKIKELSTRLREAEESLSAIRDGEVDAIVVSGNRGQQVFSLAGSDSVYRLIVESMQEAALTASRDGRILFCNAQFGAMLGAPMETLIGRKLEDFIGAEDRPLLASVLEVSESKPVRGRISLHGASRIIPSQVSASFLPLQDVPCVCIVAADLTELEASAAGLRQSNTDLQKSAARLRSLAGKLARTEERERRRLASILHDELQQLLVGAQIRLDVLLAESAKDGGSKIQGVIDLLAQSIAISRSLATEISPPIRLGSGLVAAFEWLVRSMHEKHSLTVRMTARGAIDPVSEDTATLIFRSVQELLFNIVKHAGTNAADLALEMDSDHFRITVSDQGKGFDAAKAEGASGVGSFGLFSIRERLSLVGGGMETWSKPGRGSSFTLVVPLAALRPDGGGPAPVRRASRKGAGKTSSGRMPSAGRPKKRLPVRIVVVDDHKVTREGLALLLSKEADFRIVGECDEGEAAVQLAGELEPDIVVMDVSMPGMNGIDATRAIHAHYPGIRIIGLSMLDAAGTAAAMKEAGAIAYLSKAVAPRLLVQSIRALASGLPQAAGRRRAAGPPRAAG